MEQCAVNPEFVRKWYHNYKFPLLPYLKIRKANEHNTTGFTFQWLFFTVWSLDSCEFELSFVCSSHWGIGVIGILPYLRWVISIPAPTAWGMWAQRNLWRHPENQNIKNK